MSDVKPEQRLAVAATARQDSYPNVRPVHTLVRGRLRVEVVGLRRSPAMKERIERALSGEAWVIEAQASSITGTVLVRFAPELDWRQVVPRLARVADQVRRLGSGHCESTAQPTVRAAAKTPPAVMANNNDAAPIPTVAREHHWHVRDWREAAAFFGSDSVNGLSGEEAGRRLRQHGPNLVPRPPARSTLSIILDQVNNLPVILLAGSAVVSLATGGVAEAAAIIGVVAVNTCIGYVTERNSERTIRSLTEPGVHTAEVRRHARRQRIPDETVVPGDVLCLSPGTYVAADARLVKARDLTIDQATLTGESVPVERDTRARRHAMVPISDRSNMVYKGTIVTGGSGLGIVTATGRGTEIGKIQALVGEAEPPATPMQRELGHLGRQVVWGSLAACGLVFAIGLLRGQGLAEIFKSSVALAVAAVPEGLPAMATTTLTLGVNAMRRHGVLIRRMRAVETLGATTAACVDKTGTLTLNRMSVVSLHVSGRMMEMHEGSVRNEGPPLTESERQDLVRLLEAAALCNDAKIDHQSHGGWNLKGSPTEKALVAAALTMGIHVPSLRQRYRRLRSAYRNEARRFMTTTHAGPVGTRFVAVKGNPTEVLGMCRWRQANGHREPLTEEERAALTAVNEHMATGALRVLGVAYCEPGGEAGRDHLTWLGFIGMTDPIRDGVPEALEGLHRAGIDSIMITGDQSATAYAIAKELRLGRGAPIQVLDSSHIGEMQPDMLSALARRAHAFARVSPAHKLEIVRALQRSGHVVAMTGDGVNDSPALKAADIGIAMGKGGTEVARDVADVVLERDDLASLTTAVERGRAIHHNTRRSVRFLLATNTSEILVMLTGTAVGLGQPMTPMQLLWINLATDVFPAIALALEPPHPDAMQRPPRDPHEPLVRRDEMGQLARDATVMAACGLGAYAYGWARYGPGQQASTLACLSLVGGQLLHAVTCRSDDTRNPAASPLPPNRLLTAVLGGTAAAQLAAVTFPGLRRLFGFAPLSLSDGLTIGGFALASFVLNGLLRRVRSGKREASGIALPTVLPPRAQGRPT